MATDITWRRAGTATGRGTKPQAVGQLTGGIAHGFNNLLAIIIGTCELPHPAGRTIRR
jgi:hypothetical protein